LLGAPAIPAPIDTLRKSNAACVSRFCHKINQILSKESNDQGQITVDILLQISGNTSTAGYPVVLYLYFVPDIQQQ
jgi:hypothetical protein